MNKFLKWLIAVVAVMAIMIVIMAVVIPKIFDPNNYKEKIRTAVLEETGRELTIGGEMEWSVFPTIGLDLNSLSLSDREGFTDQPMLQVTEATVSVNLIPLLSKRIEVGQISLNGVSVYLRENAAGQNNWEDLTGASSAGAVADSAIVSEVQLSNGEVALHNVSRSINMENFSGSIPAAGLAQAFELEGSLSVNLVQEAVAGIVQFGGLVQPASNGKWLGIEGIDVSFKGRQGSADDGIPLEVNMTANAEVDLASDQANLSGFIFRFFDMAINGDLKVTSLTNGPSYAGDFQLPEFSPRALLKSLGMEAPDTADSAALTKMSGNLSIAGGPGIISAQNLTLKLDKSTFTGNFDIKGSDNPVLAYSFKIDRLNLDDYSPVSTTAETEKTGENSAEPIQAFGIFFVLPGGGDLSIAELVASGLTITDINVTTSADVNTLRMIPISATLYGGQQQGDIKIDISGNRPILTTNQVLTGVQLEKLLADLTGEARLQGTGDFYMKIRSDISSSDTARRSLSGDIGLSVLDGAVIGIDVKETIGAIASALGKQSSTASNEQVKKTEFAEFIVTGIIDKGILSSDDLMLQSPILSATGKGTVNLVNETVNYTLNPVVSDVGVAGAEKISGVPIPIKITGSLYEPDISVDVIAGLTGSQKAKLDQKKDELAGSLLDKVFGSKKDKKKNKKKDDSGG